MTDGANMIEGLNSAPEDLGNVAVLGLGTSGQSVSRYLAALLGSRVRSLDIYAGAKDFDAQPPAARQCAAEAQEAGAQVFFGTEDVDGSYDLVVASPGIPQFGSFYQRALAHAREVVSEVEFAWRECPSEKRWVAITGTNGKTTTTALTAHLLSSCGWRAAAVGNIGDTCIDAVAADKADVFVAEVSSYQLASTSRFAPDCAVLLNITPDHLAWHGSFERYVEAKGRVFANLSARKGACAVIDATNSQSRAFVRQLKSSQACAYVPVGTSAGIGGDMRAACGSANAAFTRRSACDSAESGCDQMAGSETAASDPVAADSVLVVAIGGVEHELLRVGDLLLEGAHNVNNALVAASTALSLGASVEGVKSGLRSFAPLEHRLEPCGAVGGVACYNDSKATNVDAALVALNAFAGKRPVVLLGGDDKGTALDELAACVGRCCKAAVCFGAAGPRFAEALNAAEVSPAPVLAGNLEQALDAALSVSEPGDTVLLSPACASFDEFESFEHRGRVFKQLVKERQLAAEAEPADDRQG